MGEINDNSTQISKSINVKIDVKDILELLSKYDEGKSELVSQIETLKSKIVEYETQISELKQQIAEFNDQKSIEELISELANEPEPNDHKAYNYRGLICYHLDKKQESKQFEILTEQSNSIRIMQVIITIEDLFINVHGMTRRLLIIFTRQSNSTRVLLPMHTKNAVMFIYSGAPMRELKANTRKPFKNMIKLLNLILMIMNLTTIVAELIKI